MLLSDAARTKAAVAALETAQVVAAASPHPRLGQHAARRPHPRRVRRRGVAAAKKHKVTVTVIDEKQLAADGFGGILGVGQGSATRRGWCG